MARRRREPRSAAGGDRHVEHVVDLGDVARGGIEVCGVIETELVEHVLVVFVA
jgi:hypothetical protein